MISCKFHCQLHSNLFPTNKQWKMNYLPSFYVKRFIVVRQNKKKECCMTESKAQFFWRLMRKGCYPSNIYHTVFFLIGNEIYTVTDIYIPKRIVIFHRYQILMLKAMTQKAALYVYWNKVFILLKRWRNRA